MKVIEIAMGFTCNARCAFCFVPPSVRDNSFTSEDIVSILNEGIENGSETVYFGGGEPTIRRDLLPLVRYAKKAGYRTVNLKTNGMIFCYPDHAKRAIDAGATSYTIPIWGLPEIHDGYARVSGAFERTEMAIKNLVDLGGDVELDLLATRTNMQHLAALVTRFSAVGVKRFSVWYLSLFGMEEAGADMAGDLPRYTEALPHLKAVFDAGAAAGLEQIKTSHVPPCLMADMPDNWHTIVDMDLLIVTPGNSFRGEESPFECGVKVAACEGCRLWDECLGIREDYLRVHGDSEFKAVK